MRVLKWSPDVPAYISTSKIYITCLVIVPLIKFPGERTAPRKGGNSMMTVHESHNFVPWSDHMLLEQAGAPRQ